MSAINIGILTKNPEVQLNLDLDLYLELSKVHKKIYLIDLNFNEKMRNNKLPQNFIYLKPKNYKELNKIFLNKKFFCFNFLNHNFSNLLLLMIIKKFDIKHFFLMRSGTIKMNEGLFIEKKNYVNFYSIFFKKIFFKILILLKLINNYEALFISQIVKKKYYHSKKNIFLNKIFKTKNFFLYKKIVQINDKTFDTNYKYKRSRGKKIISFIDTPLDKPDKISSIHKPTETQKNLFYKKLRVILKSLSRKVNAEVLICLHPKTTKRNADKYFKGFKCTKYKSTEVIKKSYLTVYISSTLISNSIFLKKKILIVKSKLLNSFHIYRVNTLIKKFSINYIDLDKKHLFITEIIKKFIKQSGLEQYKKLSKEIYINQKTTGIKKIIGNLDSYIS